MFRTYGLIAAFLFVLTGCGGGGGGTADNGNTTPDTPQIQPSSLVTSVQQTTYQSNSPESIAFDILNNARSHCGFGLLQQNTSIDTAAAGHSLWNVTNNYTGHFQVANTPNFTGVTTYDRLTSSGYSTSSASYFAQESVFNNLGSSTPDLQDLAAIGTRLLLNAPYHAIQMIDGFREAGVGIGTNTTAQSRHQTNLVFNFAYKYNQGAQLLAGDAVSTYPCDGTINVDRQLTNESPNPVPGRDLAQQPLGSSIMILVRQGQTLNITSATLTNLATGAAVTLRTPSTSTTDPNNALQSHQAFVSADAPLDALTQYQANISGTNNGRPFSRTFSFTTGS